MKKIIGLSTGRKNGNSECLLKAAAMGAAEIGVETEIIRAMDLRVLPCKGCFACAIDSESNMVAKNCVLDDDVDWILEKTMVEDAALIVATPCYHLRANAYLMAIAERSNHVSLMHPEIHGRKNVLKFYNKVDSFHPDKVSRFRLLSKAGDKDSTVGSSGSVAS